MKMYSMDNKQINKACQRNYPLNVRKFHMTVTS